MNILVVDDNEDTRTYLSRRLKAEGYVVETAQNGVEALEKARQAPPELVISDILMPEMDGFELCRRWKADARLALVPFVVYTATYTDSRDEKLALELGADRFIVKPQESEVLIEILKDVLRTRQAGKLASHEGHDDDMERLRQYSVILFAKLQKKLQQLELEILERKQAEENVRRLNAELEERVLERTAELQSANEELVNFSTWVAHDLRTPLRAIDGFSQEVLTNCGPLLDDASKRDLRRIRAATQRMSELIDALLKLALLGGGPLSRQEVDLSAQASDIVQKLKNAEPSRPIDIAVAPRLRANVDPALFQIALENLLQNAWKFTQKQSQARIEFGELNRQGVQQFYVRDNGAGFDMAYKEKLFKPFERLHTTQEFAGTGIGLALVHRIIRRHGGRIWAESDKDRGATFYFTLS